MSRRAPEEFAFLGLDEATRDSRSFISRTQCELCGCVLFFSNGEEHLRGRRHVRRYRSYQNAHRFLKIERNQAKRLACLQQARTSPFWVGDLANVKSALLDWVDDGAHESREVVYSAWRAHVRREQAFLLLLAVTKASISSVSGSLDSAREQGVLLGDSRAWGRLLLETAGSGNLVLSLVVPFVPDHYLTTRRPLWDKRYTATEVDTSMLDKHASSAC